MSKIFSSWSLGPGLTSQIGPFKTNKRDYPKLQKVPWKGGGVAGGGQGHAGNGNYYSAITPQAFPMQFPQPTGNPSRYASIVTAQDIYKPTAYRGPPGTFAKAAQATGQPAPVGTQKMGMGIGGSHRTNPGEQDNDAGIYADAQEEPNTREPYNETDAAMAGGYPTGYPTPREMNDEPMNIVHTPHYTASETQTAQHQQTEGFGIQTDPSSTRDFNSQTMVVDEEKWANRLEGLVMSLSDENAALAEKAARAGAEASAYTAEALSSRQQEMMHSVLSHFGLQNIPEYINPDEFHTMVSGLADVTPMLIREREGLENFARGMREYTADEERQFKEYQQLKAQQAGLKGPGGRKRHRAGYYDDVSGRARLTGQDASTSTNEAKQFDNTEAIARKLRKTDGMFGSSDRVEPINTAFPRFKNNEPKAEKFKELPLRKNPRKSKYGGITGQI